MATIALYSNKINQMPGLIKDLKNSVTDYKSELATLKNKSLTINKSVCNLDDIISSIQSATQTQEQKIASLETFHQNSEQFISDTVRIDSDVADLVKQRKDNFFEKYYYLKPECEKNDWEKFKDGCKAVGKWCKEHWKITVKIAKDVFVSIGKVILGGVLAIAGLASIISTLPLALLLRGGGFLTQIGFSTMMYGAFMVGSVFDSQIQADMDAIGWNPFNSDVSLLTGESKKRKVSFYKGMPVFWTNQSIGRSGSFLGLWLADNNMADIINHEWGHGIQQGIMGPLRYLLMIGLPSWQEWGPSGRDYYNRPWEITADMFGGVTRPTHTQEDIKRGWRYLWVSTLFGALGYTLVPF